MTIQDLTPEVKYTGTGNVTIFSFAFEADENDDIFATVDDSDAYTYVTAFNVDQDSNPGGTVTFDTAPPSGTEVRIWRSTDVDQETAYPDYDRFPASAHERALDKITMILQEIWASLNSLWNKALIFPEDNPQDNTVPSVEDRTNKYFYWDSDGNPSIASGTEGSGGGDCSIQFKAAPGPSWPAMEVEKGITNPPAGYDGCKVVTHQWLADNLGFSKYSGSTTPDTGITVAGDADINRAVPSAFIDFYGTSMALPDNAGPVFKLGEYNESPSRLITVDTSGSIWVYISYSWSTDSFEGQWIEVGAVPVQEHEAKSDPHPQYLLPEELPSTLVGLFTAIASTVDSNFYIVQTPKSNLPESSFAATTDVVDTPVLLQQWIREPVVGTEYTWDVVNSNISLDVECDNDNSEVYVELSLRKANGTEVLIGESNRTDLKSGRQVYNVTINAGPIDVAIGDSPISRVYVNKTTSGADTDILMYVDGNHVSRTLTTIPYSPEFEGMYDLIDDETPQLGGDLDLNDFYIGQTVQSTPPAGHDLMVIDNENGDYFKWSTYSTTMTLVVTNAAGDTALGKVSIGSGGASIGTESNSFGVTEAVNGFRMNGVQYMGILPADVPKIQVWDTDGSVSYQPVPSLSSIGVALVAATRDQDWNVGNTSYTTSMSIARIDAETDVTQVKHDSVDNTKFIAVKAGFFEMRFTSNCIRALDFVFYVNGVPQQESETIMDYSGYYPMEVTHAMHLNAGDYIQLYFRSSTANGVILANSSLMFKRLGDG